MPAARMGGGRRVPPLGAALAVLASCSALACDATPATPPPPPPLPASVVLAPTDTTLLEGETVALQVTVRDSAGQPLTQSAVRWSAFPASIVTVTDAGVVQTLALGTAHVVAKAGGRADTALVTVRIRFAALSAGAEHTCGITTTGSTYCWGRNLEGRLGDGTVEGSAIPTRVATAARLIQLSAGWEITCGRTAQSAACWGSNRSGQLGSASKDDALRPVALANDLPLAGIATYGMHSCGFGGSDHYAYCWGANWAGQLGDGGLGGRWPHPVAGTRTFAAIDVGWLHSCGVTTDGEAYCWGADHLGQLGRPDAPDQCTWLDGSPLPCALTPLAVAGGLTFDTIAVGRAHACALIPGGQAYCWGDNDAGQLGTGSTARASTPQAVVGAPPFTMISAGDRHTCALAADGSLWCWGDGGSGALGRTTVPEICNGRPCSTVPRPAETALRFASVTASRGGTGLHTCGLATDGVAYCWGSSAWGQLGIGVASIQTGVPVRVYGQP
jgi:alpha-tubulin suppressor-like RCC1 family protein